jgi:hypothetical protein
MQRLTRPDRYGEPSIVAPAPRSEDRAVSFGAHALQIVGAVLITYVVLHFILKTGDAQPPALHLHSPLIADAIRQAPTIDSALGIEEPAF